MRGSWVWIHRCRLGVGLAALAAAGGGCGAGRVVSISTTPADAMLKIDDVETARAPAAENFHFDHGASHKVLATHVGYSDQERVLSLDPQTHNLVAAYKDPNGREVRETVGDELRIPLPPARKQITINVTPVPGWVALDGVPLTTGPVNQVTRWVDFSVGPENRWLPHTVTVSHPGFADVSRKVEWTDPDPPVYTIPLAPYRKDLRIVSRPPGAEIFINGESRGAEPVTIRDFAFPVDPKTGQFLPQKVTARKPGFDPVDFIIGWDNGRTDYAVDLAGKNKTVRITTDPPGGVVTLDGSELPRDASGVSTTTLAFSPTDDKGTPKVYTCKASRKQGDREWESAPFQIAWDNGRPAYSVAMAEVKTRTVALVRPRFVFGDGGWRATAQTVPTTAPRDTSEPAGATGATAVTLTPVLRLPAANGAGAAGAAIDTLATSPDGSQIVFTVLSVGSGGEPHSQLEILDVDGGDGGAPRTPRLLGDDKSLSLFPSFSPDGKRVLFSSNREGKRMAIWSVPADGSAAPARVTAGDSTDLWPSLDSLSQPRLFYETLLEGRREPRLFVARLGAGPGAAAGAGAADGGTDLAQDGSQPHVSPAADAVLFDAPAGGAGSNSGTAAAPRRHLFTIPDGGGRAVELNHTADFDDFDPAWSKDGSRIAFASNRPRGATGASGAAGARAAASGDYNIWIIDPAHPDAAALQVTFNGAWDDCPTWDAAGKAVYFRSNRGGTWGIWKVSWR